MPIGDDTIGGGPIAGDVGTAVGAEVIASDPLRWRLASYIDVQTEARYIDAGAEGRYVDVQTESRYIDA
jgi:hypothetical protein